MQEYRRSIRWSVNQPGLLKLGQAESLPCQIKDINHIGAKVTLNAKLPLDTALKINFQLAEDLRVDAEIWVAWHKLINGVNHYGLYFSKIKDADKKKITKFIKQYCPADAEQKSVPEIAGAENENQKGKGGEEMDDHRIFERFKKEFYVRFIGLDGKEGTAQTYDVSAKGLGISTASELQPRSALEIWLDVPHSTDPLYTRGQVVWSKPAGTDNYRSGIELERADLMNISRLLHA